MFSEDRVLTPGLLTKWNATGGRVVGIHYGADPDKDAAWAARAKVGYPNREWMREMEGYTNVFEGEPVFDCYNPDIHLSNFDMPTRNDKGILIAGWDVGVSLNPAFVLGFLSQENGEPDQLRLLMEVIAQGMPMQQFAPFVISELDSKFKGWRKFEHEIIHVADPAGEARQGVTGSTAFAEAKRHGFHLRRSKNPLQPRISCVTRMLMGWAVEDVAPLMVINKQYCPVIVEAFGGGYAYRDNKLAGNARRVREPRKDGYSHPMDAVQYLCMEAEKWMEGNRGACRPFDRIGGSRKPTQAPIRYV